MNDQKIIEKLRSRAFHGIIFDFDGTILDIMDSLQQSIEEVFTEKNIQADMELTIQEIGATLESIQGYPIPKILLQSFEIFKAITSLSHLTYLKKLRIAMKIFGKYQQYAKDAVVFPKAKELISFLKGECILFIVSHNQTRSIIETLEKEEIEQEFKEIYGADKLPALKPHPDAFLPILEQYEKTKGSDWLVIGDMPSDIEAAKEAGLCTIGIASGISKRDILASYSPDLLVDSLKELLELVGIRNGRISDSNVQTSLKIKS
jgi:phosphoglycolate phosphatase